MLMAETLAFLLSHSFVENFWHFFFHISFSLQWKLDGEDARIKDYMDFIAGTSNESLSRLCLAHQMKATGLCSLERYTNNFHLQESPLIFPPEIRMGPTACQNVDCKLWQSCSGTVAENISPKL